MVRTCGVGGLGGGLGSLLDSLHPRVCGKRHRWVKDGAEGTKGGGDF